MPEPPMDASDHLADARAALRKADRARPPMDKFQTRLWDLSFGQTFNSIDELDELYDDLVTGQGGQPAEPVTGEDYFRGVTGPEPGPEQAQGGGGQQAQGGGGQQAQGGGQQAQGGGGAPPAAGPQVVRQGQRPPRVRQ